MAKRPKSLPVRKLLERDDSLLLRSAESLGRMIGTLQRQLDVASKRLVPRVVDGVEQPDAAPARRKNLTAAKRSRKTPVTTRKTTAPAARKRSPSAAARSTKKR